jgi:hypothetical protein
MMKMAPLARAIAALFILPSSFCILCSKPDHNLGIGSGTHAS